MSFLLLLLQRCLPTIETYGSCAAAAAALPLSGCDNKKETKMLWGCVQWGWLFFVVPDAFFLWPAHTHKKHTNTDRTVVAAAAAK